MEEDAALLKHFEAGMALEDIAKQLRRGVYAVEVRLWKLGKVTPGVAAGAARASEEMKGAT